MMSWLMADGSGPLYNRRYPDALHEALSEVAALLDPSAI